MIMSIEHADLPIAAVQFHRESPMASENEVGMPIMASVLSALADGCEKGHLPDPLPGPLPNPSPWPQSGKDEEVIKHVVARIRGGLMQEIQEMNAGNPALAMISLPPECPDQRVGQATPLADGPV
jgi:hypothetical protein